MAETFKIGGVTYIERVILCGNDCETCKAQGGHRAIYMYIPAANGVAGRWKSVGTVRPAGHEDPRTRICAREGCGNETSRPNQKYCSAACRVKANRASKTSTS